MAVERQLPSPLAHYDPADLLDALATGIVVLDAQLCVVYANVAAQGLLAMSFNQARGRPYADLFAESNGLVATLKRARDAGDVYSEREVTVRPAATPRETRVLDITITPLDGMTGTKLLLELSDETQRTRLTRESELRARLEGIPHVGADGEFWSPPVPDAQHDLRLIGPFRNNAPEFTLVEGDGAEPGRIRRAHGKGEAIWLPWRIGALHHLFAITDYAAILGHLLESAIGTPPIVTTAPAAVECILYGHPRGVVLHLVNGAAAQTKPLIATVPLAGFEVAVATDATHATRLDTGAKLAATRDGGMLRFVVDRLDSFLAVALT